MFLNEKKEIFLEQKKILNDCYEYLKNIKKNGIKINFSPLCFFTTWTKSYGYFKILHLRKKKFFLIF